MRLTFSRSLRALPTLLRVGVAETVAYRGELVVWMLTTTMPLIMLGLWTTVASEGPFRNFSSADFQAYYLAMMIVRNLTGTWVAWQIGDEIRLGTMAMRLLRPVHPVLAFATTHLAGIPFRTALAVPVAVVLLFSAGASSLPHDPVQLALVVPSLVLAWWIGFALMFALGSLAFWITKLNAISQLYFIVSNLFSGYLLPLQLLPRWIADVAELTPFASMLSTPVRMLTHELPGDELARMLGMQAGWAITSSALALAVWRLGVRRFESVGG